HARTVPDSHLACPAPPPLSVTTTPNSTLSIKVSKLIQAPPPTHSPSLSTHKGSAVFGHRDLGSGGAHLAQYGRRTRPPEGHLGHQQTLTDRVTRRQGGAARGPKERREEGRWLVGCGAAATSGGPMCARGLGCARPAAAPAAPAAPCPRGPPARLGPGQPPPPPPPPPPGAPGFAPQPA
ncbi:hypothetical protein MC885_010264, partial [Smutsia gigantea]